MAEFRQHLAGEIVETRPLGPDPVLERCLLDVEALDQATTVKPRRLGQGVGRAFRRKPHEMAGVDVGGVGVQPNVIAVRQQNPRLGIVKSLAQFGDALTEALAGLFLEAVAPKERRQPVPRLRLAGVERQVGQKRPRLPAGKADLAAGAVPDLEPAEKPDR